MQLLKFHKHKPIKNKLTIERHVFSICNMYNIICLCTHAYLHTTTKRVHEVYTAF